MLPSILILPPNPFTCKNSAFSIYNQDILLSNLIFSQIQSPRLQVGFRV